MKVKIEIVIGFLDSGKTSFINSMLQSEELKNEIIVVFQDEFGEKEIEKVAAALGQNNEIIVIKNEEDKQINSTLIKDIIKEYAPDRIFIEVNGMKDSSDIIEIFNEKTIKNISKIEEIVNIIDVEKFPIYFKNISFIISKHIFNSETIILNNVNKLSKKEFVEIQKQIKNINETADIIKHVSSIKLNGVSRDEYIEVSTNHKFFIFKVFVYLSLIILAFTYLITLSLSDTSIYAGGLDKFGKFYYIFISILIQGFPFILIGSFVSAIIQIYISKERFIRLFPRNSFLSCIIAAFAGLLFPICDCGTIPVVKGLIRKNVPIAAGITFMLAAPIVNPIAIISTIYAFQGMKSIVIYRVIAGIIISISVGLIVQFSSRKDEEILLINENTSDCECGFCSGEYGIYNNTYQKIKAIFIHAGDEFFNVGKFMIIGTFLSSIFQSTVYADKSSYITYNNWRGLIEMIGLSFLLSVCSTSDAFIAKGFLKQFSINSVMGFLVVGPMLDIKNTIMLFGTFKKKFVLKLIVTILIVSFIYLINFTLT